VSINYDSAGVPDIPPGLSTRAKELGWQVIHVICEEKDAKVDEPTGVDFWAITPFLPRKGEQIVLDDRKVCEVDLVLYRVHTVTDANGNEVETRLYLTVVAFFTGKTL
jgi:hypothetical protein